MSKMTLLLDEPLSGDIEVSLPERVDGTSARIAFEPGVLDEEPELHWRASEPTRQGQALVRIAPGDTAASGPEDGGDRQLASTSATAPQNAASFSRGLVGTYFRQMGDAAWLSREEEITLAKRIEACQHAMLTSLLRRPHARRANCLLES